VPTRDGTIRAGALNMKSLAANKVLVLANPELEKNLALNLDKVVKSPELTSLVLKMMLKRELKRLDKT